MTGPKRRVLTLALFLVSVAAWALVLGRLHVEMAITHFLPAGSDGEIPEILHALTESELARTTIVDLGADAEHHPDLLRVAKGFVADLRTRPSVDRLRSGLEPGDDEKVIQTLRSVPPSAFLRPDRFTPEGYERRLAALKEDLAGPLGPLASAFAPTDPMGATLGVLDRLRRLEGQTLGSEDGILFSEDGAHAFVFVTGRGSAFDADTQKRFLHDLDDSLAKAGGGGLVKLEVSSVAKYTVVSEKMIRGDIERIGTLSTLGILLLFGLFFRSLRMLLLALVPLLFGTILATVASFFLFGSVHGVTLAFGSSLLGVGIDYAEHYFSHFSLSPERGADRVMHEVRPGLGLGALTTIVGLAGIAWADFPGAKELAIFSCLAVLGSLIGTIVFLPPWMPADYKRPPLPVHLERAALHWLAALRRRKSLAWLSLAACGVLTLGMARAHFVDDVTVLLATDPVVAAEDQRVRGRITRAEPGRFAVVLGQSEQEALERLDATTQALAAAHDDGLVEHYVPLGELLRSEKAQRDSFRAAKESVPEFERALQAQGFELAPFRPYVDSLAGEPVVLTPARLIDSPLGDLVRPLCPTLGTKQGYIIPLGGVPSLEKLRERLPQATVIDERALLESTYSHVRQRVLQLVGGGLFVVLAILRVRYRTWRTALAAFVPGALAGFLTIGTFGWLGVPLNVLHAVGLVLVLSMGVDFGIFVAEGRASDEETARALVGIFTATLTTLLSFGLLAWSQSPALRALGSTMSLGLVWSLLLCPAVFILAEHVKEPSS